MKYLKKFEGNGRIKIKGNQVHVGDTNLPQFWSENPGYTPKKDIPTQRIGGVDITTLVPAPGTDYNYIVDPDDHLDKKEIDEFIKPHIKKFNDFGFNPMNEKLGVVDGLEEIAEEIIEEIKRRQTEYGPLSYKRNQCNIKTEWRDQEINLNFILDSNLKSAGSFRVDGENEFTIMSKDLDRITIIHELKHLDRSVSKKSKRSKISKIKALSGPVSAKYKHLLKHSYQGDNSSIISDVIYYSNPDEFEAYFNELYSDLKSKLEGVDVSERRNFIKNYLDITEIYIIYRYLYNNKFDISLFFKNNRNANSYMNEINKRVKEMSDVNTIKMKTNKVNIILDKISKFVMALGKDEDVSKDVKKINNYINYQIGKNYPKFHRLYTLLA